MTNDEIIETGRMWLAIYNMDDATFHANPEMIERAEAAMQRVKKDDYAGGMLVMTAVKLLGGSGYQIISDNPKHIDRLRSLAADLGARVVDAHVPDGDLSGSTRIVVAPPDKH